MTLFLYFVITTTVDVHLFKNVRWGYVDNRRPQQLVLVSLGCFVFPPLIHGSEHSFSVTLDI